MVLEGIPHVRQEPDFCGEACLEMALRWHGLDVDQDAVFALTGVDPALGRGAWTRELKVAAEALGFAVGPVWFQVAPGPPEEQWAALLADLEAGVPSIICMRTGPEAGANEHFRLVVGYDPTADQVLFHEPARARAPYQRLDRDVLLDLWPLPYDSERWTVVRLPLRAGTLVAPAPEAAPTRAQLAQEVMRVWDTMPDGFTMVVEPPFVVVGDGPPEAVRRRAEGTVRWAVQRLEEAYFTRRPEQVWSVWLFEDDRSYRSHARSLFGDDPDTPYGYATGAREHALVMNIGTGGGTLVHEFVHPYMAANFPACPPWFNEGLASLYEYAAERQGRIVGLTNWRLDGLQSAIVAGEAPPFHELMAQDEDAFYGADPGTNYAQSRYLCQYLQKRDLLVTYYREFLASREADPTGYASLQRVLGRTDMDAFQEEWEAWVLGLRQG